MQIKETDSTNKPYLSFIESNAGVYNTPAWLSLYGRNCKVMGVYEKDVLLAVFTIYTFKKAVLTFFIPPPFSPDCNLLIATGADEKQIKNAIILWAEKEAKKSYAFFGLNFSYKWKVLLEENEIKDCEKKLHHTYVLDIGKTDEVESLYAPKRRQQIRRALKDNLQVAQLRDMQVVFDLVKQTFARQNKSIDEAFVKKILFEFANSSNSFAFASVKDGKYSVAYFCIYHQKEAFYLMGGYDEEQKHIGAGPLAMNACITHAKKLGVEVFDFEGSMEPSIEKYFKEFGGEKKQYPCYEKTSTLGKAAVRIKKIIKG